ncbi:MAG: DUF1275 domain-containing protein [Solirubrobacterales bacterium]|nr:DUF1275 domain-containing protein [Solirubrobacterales bacterium]
MTSPPQTQSRPGSARPSPTPPARPVGAATLLALTFVTGIVDAVAFLALGQVFAAMQTGNVIFLGFGLAGAEGAPVAGPLAALVAFVAGGALVAVVVGAGRRGLTLRAAMAVEVVLLAGAAVAVAVVEPAEGEAAAYAVVAVLALAMGLRNTVARQEGNPNFATTVLNLTLTAVSVPAQAGVASRDDLRERGLAIVAILLGALVGALLLRIDPALALGAAAAVAAVALVTSR